MGDKDRDNVWNADRWIALSSAVVAGCALLLSLWQLRSYQQDRRIAVMPHFGVTFYSSGEQGLGWMAGNSGLGPAILEWFKVTVDGNEVYTWRQMLTSLGIDKSAQFKFVIPQSGTMIRPTEEGMRLFWMVPGPFGDQLRERQHRVRLQFCYRSLYGEYWIESEEASPIPVSSCEPRPRDEFHFER